MDRHFIDTVEAYGNGYADPRRVAGRLLPGVEVISPHECIPGICRIDHDESGESPQDTGMTAGDPMPAAPPLHEHASR
ncbi:hypothetical protein [Phytomonospora endophytica]|uniref:Uncharacterized protein n=1 Tax=Phytomonospora endophytica TaxID=714109 RepID=A0A841FZH7_9ACTN|nr:hypothetical protein [Phytomonospora endophytica]MBB6037849.1 hypothetical protein [Phytomonospora endophytica]GIG68748.1 hypothetical protein Pen01_50430 [Phytomonospora endophytica]